MLDMTIDRMDPTVLTVKSWHNTEGKAVLRTATTYAYHILYVKVGVCKLTLEDGRFYGLRSDDIFFFVPGTVYTAQFESTPKNHFIEISFDVRPNNNKALLVALMNERADSSVDAIELCHFSDSSMFNESKKLKPSAQTNRIFDRIDREYRKKQEFHPQIASLHLHTVLYSLLREQDSAEQIKVTNASERIMRYVNEHVHEKITNESAAQALTYHPNYINSVIKQATGKTFHKYVIDVKLHVAMDLLLNTQESVTDIAQALAFSTSSHFNRLFIKTTRCTPSEFRKRFY
ncbi:MAG: helix-turn-helix transcriptional regulator [Clostridia bacterium]|nr:helix-turn-helix transcriptional regulator [Clostridia bacterium]